MPFILSLLNSPTPWQPRAHIAANTTSNTPQWLLDSDSSHHVISNLSNLFYNAPYTGSNDIIIGDGMGLKITHISSTSLTTPTTTFTLNNVLCITSMKKSLTSILEFYCSNNVLILILPSYFL